MKNRTQTWHRIVAKNPILQVSDIPCTEWLTFPCPIKSPLVYYLYGPFQKRARGISYEIIIVKRFRSTLWLTFTEENNEVAEKEFFWKLTTTRFLSAYKTNFHEWVFVIFHETSFFSYQNQCSWNACLRIEFNHIKKSRCIISGIYFGFLPA